MTIFIAVYGFIGTILCAWGAAAQSENEQQVAMGVATATGYALLLAASLLTLVTQLAP